MRRERACRTTDEAPVEPSAEPPLVVDVDGSLIGGDLLIEGIARMLSASPLSLFALDARCAPERVREGYPRFGAFEAVRAAVAGAPPRFASELSRRLAL